MTAPATSLPYTDAAGEVLGTTSYDLPNMQTLSFSEVEEFAELRGDDRLVAIRGQGANLEWELEAGGLSLVVWEILTGGTIIESGVTPNKKWILRKMGTNARGWFRVEGQIMSESGGDFHAMLYRCRCNDSIEGEFADGEFFVTSASGQGLPLLTVDENGEPFDLLYDLIQNETAVAIPTTAVANPTPPETP